MTRTTSSTLANSRLWLCAALFQFTLLLSSNASATIWCPSPSLSERYQQADFVGQLKVLADGTETQKLPFGDEPLKKMQVELIGADVRGVQAAANRKPEANTQWAWLKASTTVGTVHDIIMDSYASFDEGRWAEVDRCIKKSLFETGNLDKLLPPKGSGGAVLLQTTDYTEISRRFSLSTDYFPAYALVNVDVPQAKRIALDQVKNGRLGDVQATGIPVGRYRIEPAFYPPGFSRVTFTKQKGALDLQLQVIDRGAVFVIGGVYADQRLWIESASELTESKGTGQSASNPALLMPKPTYQLAYLSGAVARRGYFDTNQEGGHPLLAGTYSIRTKFAGIPYADGTDGIRQVSASDKNAEGYTTLAGMTDLNKLPFVTLRIDFKTADGQAVRPNVIEALAIESSLAIDKPRHETTLFIFDPKGTSVYLKALKGVDYTISSSKELPGNRRIEVRDFAWRAKANSAVTIILK